MYAPKAQKTEGNQHSAKTTPNQQPNPPPIASKYKKKEIADRLYL